MTVDNQPLSFTQAMARVPGPVVVATTVDEHGRRWGFTASSFVSLSLDPPLVMVGLDKRASTHGAFTAADHFMINVLASDQSAIARRFAASGVDRFAAGDTVPLELGLPGIPQALVRLVCRMHDVVDGGDHSILIGGVDDCVGPEHREALVYVDRSFVRPAGPALAVARAR
ncbi:flavin reductase family protein [Streptomyces sp. ID05-04B]|uniref:flavin reductase family protein n=1 Tax=unclassified Streptomyces TaxID=2593676 RepID=UPI000D1A009B|nr:MULTISPECIES: flavin reductase family protein [unclassified Streptomyces]AVV41409.1 flavin reductase [Streptomyces sp. P3]MDX5565533.1 flavin reductase family protein [Streptomyces sp. ID05-04B]